MRKIPLLCSSAMLASGTRRSSSHSLARARRLGSSARARALSISNEGGRATAISAAGEPLGFDAREMGLDQGRRRVHKSVYARRDNFVDVAGRRQAEEPAALAEIELRRVKGPDQVVLELGQRNFIEAGQAMIVTHLVGDTRKDLLAVARHEADVMPQTVETGESEQPNPFVIVHQPHIVAIKGEQPLFEAQAPFAEPIGPGGIPIFREPFLVDAIDQHVLAREITIDQRL